VSDLPQTSTGKIARLPARLREEVNRRLHDGDSGPVLLEWLNATPEALDICAKHFGGEPISPQNLSAWRQGQYARWLKQCQTEQRIREQSEFYRRVAEASGGNLAEGVLAELTGKMVTLSEAIETFVESADDGDEGQDRGKAAAGLAELVSAVSTHVFRARGRELETIESRRKEREMQQRERELALKETKFQRDTAELFDKFYNDKRAQEIMASKSDKAVRMESLVNLIFGPKPSTAAAA